MALRELLRSMLGGPTPRSAAAEQATEAEKVKWPSRSRSSERSGEPVVDRYFDLSRQIEESMKAGDYGQAVEASRECIALIAPLVIAIKRRSESFDIESCVAVHKGAKAMMALGKRAELEEALRSIRATREVHLWAREIEWCLEYAGIADRIMRAVEQTPGIRQSELRKQFPKDDERGFADVCYWLERVGRMIRLQEGRTYELYPRTPVEPQDGDDYSTVIVASSSSTS